MFKDFKKVLNLIGKQKTKPLIYFSSFSLLLIFLELLGITILIPIISFITNNNSSFFVFEFFFNDKNFLLLIGILIFIFISKNLLIIYLSHWQMKFSGKIHLDLSGKLLKYYLKMPYEQYLNINSSIHIKNIENECQNFSHYLVAYLGLIVDVILSLVLILLLLRLNFFYTSIIFVFFFTISFILYFLSKTNLKKWSKERMETARKVLQNLMETIGSIKEIKTYEKEEKFVDQHIKNLRKNIYSSIKTNIIRMYPKSTFEVSFIFLISVVLIYIRFSENTLNSMLPTIVAFMAAGIKLLPTFSKILGQLQTIRSNKISIEVLHNEFNQILLKPSVDQGNEILVNSFKLNKIQFKEVSFNYLNNKKEIIQKLNLKLEIGKCYCIIGETGSGKTTLTNLLLKLLIPTSGQILINDKYDLQKIKNRFYSFVPQKIYLLDSSIRSNIALEEDDTKISENLLNSSIKLAQLESFVDNLPQKTYTKIGENASRLSGGQLQRLGIARSIYNKSQLMIFDEPTSSLDQLTEKKIYENIKLLKNDRIIIIVSHSKEIKKFVDQIIEIKDSKILTYE